MATAKSAMGMGLQPQSQLTHTQQVYSVVSSFCSRFLSCFLSCLVLRSVCSDTECRVAFLGQLRAKASILHRAGPRRPTQLPLQLVQLRSNERSPALQLEGEVQLHCQAFRKKWSLETALHPQPVRRQLAMCARKPRRCLAVICGICFKSRFVVLC